MLPSNTAGIVESMQLILASLSRLVKAAMLLNSALLSVLLRDDWLAIERAQSSRDAHRHVNAELGAKKNINLNAQRSRNGTVLKKTRP